jgi:hypothetical protein
MEPELTSTSVGENSGGGGGGFGGKPRAQQQQRLDFFPAVIPEAFAGVTTQQQAGLTMSMAHQNVFLGTNLLGIEDPMRMSNIRIPVIVTVGTSQPHRSNSHTIIVIFAIVDKLISLSR